MGVCVGALGEMSVDLGEFGWFPEVLPELDEDLVVEQGEG